MRSTRSASKASTRDYARRSRSEPSIIRRPGGPDDDEISGRVAGARSSRPGVQAERRELHHGLEAAGFPAAAANTSASSLLSTIGAVISSAWWRTASRGSGSRGRTSCSSSCSRRSSCRTRSRSCRVRHLHVARLERDLAAADRPALLRERVQRVPAAPVLHDDPARPRRGRDDRRRRARSGSCGRSSSRSRSRRSSR